MQKSRPKSLVELWDELSSNPDEMPVTEEQLNELDRRFEEYRQDPDKVVTMLPSSRRQFTVMVNSNFASSSIWPAKHCMATAINKPSGTTGLFKSWTRLALGAMAGTPGRS